MATIMSRIYVPCLKHARIFVLIARHRSCVDARAPAQLRGTEGGDRTRIRRCRSSCSGSPLRLERPDALALDTVAAIAEAARSAAVGDDPLRQRAGLFRLHRDAADLPRAPRRALGELPRTHRARCAARAAATAATRRPACCTSSSANRSTSWGTSRRPWRAPVPGGGPPARRRPPHSRAGPAPGVPGGLLFRVRAESARAHDEPPRRRRRHAARAVRGDPAEGSAAGGELPQLLAGRHRGRGGLPRAAASRSSR